MRAGMLPLGRSRAHVSCALSPAGVGPGSIAAEQDSYVQQAHAAYQAGDYTTAIALCQSVSVHGGFIWLVP